MQGEIPKNLAGKQIQTQPVRTSPISVQHAAAGSSAHTLSPPWFPLAPFRLRELESERILPPCTIFDLSGRWSCLERMGRWESCFMCCSESGTPLHYPSLTDTYTSSLT